MSTSAAKPIIPQHHAAALEALRHPKTTSKNACSVTAFQFWILWRATFITIEPCLIH
jgi:hypothetical protein